MPWRKYGWVVYLITVHLLLLLMLAKSNFIPKVKEKLGWQAPTPDVHLPNMRRVHLWMDESVPAEATLFIGDSIVQSLAAAAVTPQAINYGIGASTAAQWVDLIPQYAALQRVRTIMLSVGINDVLMGAAVQLPVRYQKILALLPADTPLVWSGILPTRLAQINNADLQRVNEVIKSLCAQRGHCSYVDPWPLFMRQGEPASELFVDDGIHLSAAGYRAWIAALKVAIATQEG